MGAWCVDNYIMFSNTYFVYAWNKEIDIMKHRFLIGKVVLLLVCFIMFFYLGAYSARYMYKSYYVNFQSALESNRSVKYCPYCGERIR